MQDIKIEKNVPIPEQRGKIQDLLHAFEVGDSAIFPVRNSNGIFYSAAKKLGIRIHIKSVDAGWRIWRVK